MSVDPWGPLSPPEDGCLTRRFGDATVMIRTREDEWEIARSYDPVVGVDPVVGTDAIPTPSWTRYVTIRNDTLSVTPALPDRPVVVRPESPIVILPGRWGRFFVAVPLWVRFVSDSRGKETVMEEIPSRVPPSTWFGDIETGELCYALDVPLRRDVDPEIDPAAAVCEVRVTNSSRERLKFERICVHVEHMRLYRADGRLWTNEVRVGFKGADQVSQLSFRSGPPERHPVADVVCEPRLPPESNLIKRSFNFFREIAGL